MERSYARIKANTVKLVLDVELLKANYNELKDSLYSTKSQVDSVVTENVAVKSKLFKTPRRRSNNVQEGVGAS